MVVSARDVAAVLRARQPGLPNKKLHKLLYYCQGHHLAAFGYPLFSESISAWDMGPVVGQLWGEEKHENVPMPPPRELGEAELNTIGYVLSRYGTLSGADLERLTHSEAPWRAADNMRKALGEKSAKIDPEWIKKDFDRKEAEDAEDRPQVSQVALAQWLEGAQTRRSEARRPDKREEILARLSQRG
jgi:uncharacterized phage-associated protein